MGCCSICARLSGRSRGQIQDRALRRVHERGPQAWFLQIAPGLSGRILEVGCGTGILFADYPAGAEVTAIDSDADFLAVARDAAAGARARITLLRADAHVLPLADDVFDAVIVQLVLCSVDDSARALREMVRVLRPGGRLYLYEHVLSANPAYRLLQHATAPLVRWLGEGCRWNRDTTERVRETGLDIESHERGTLPLVVPLPVVRIVARKSV